jgi:hypothetical protein
MVWSVSSLSWYYMNPAGCEGFPTSTLIMPFLNMFKSRRTRSTSLPRAPERHLLESEYDPASAYGPRSGFGRSAHHPAPPHTGSRTQRYPSHGSSFSNSGARRYAESATASDQVRTIISRLQCPELVFLTKRTPARVI